MTWRIGEILIQKKLISWNQLQEALGEQERTKELAGEILVRKGYVSQRLLYKALAEQYSIQFVDLNRIKINPKAITYIPASIARKFQIMPVELLDETLVIAVGNALNIWPEHEIKQISKIAEIRTILALPEAIKETIRIHYGADDQEAVG